jgi:hypothetical protein
MSFWSGYYVVAEAGNQCSTVLVPLQPGGICFALDKPFTCQNLRPTFILKDKNQEAPFPTCLGGKESWGACRDGAFLCRKKIMLNFFPESIRRIFKYFRAWFSWLDCNQNILNKEETLFVNDRNRYVCTDLSPEFSTMKEDSHFSPSPRCLNVEHSMAKCSHGQFLCQDNEKSGGWRNYIQQHRIVFESLYVHKLCILVPFRDDCPRFNRAKTGERKRHLQIFVRHMRTFLEGVDFEFVLIVQSRRGLFNKGTLFNVGARVAEQRNCDYLALHDIDHLPTNEVNKYAWPPRPIHLCTNTSDVECCYDFAGGAVLLQMRHFVAINGFSNMYYGWGGEDADLYYRVVRVYGSFDRLDPQIGHYEVQIHRKDDASTHQNSHQENIQYLMNFRNSMGMGVAYGDGYSSYPAHAEIINASVVGNMVIVYVEVLKDGVLMPEC